MLLATTHTIEGRQLETLGLLHAESIFSKNFAKDIGQGLKSLVGGELKSYTDLLRTAVESANNHLVEAAEAMGADAVVGVQYSTSNLIDGGAEVIVCGTAVKFAE